MLLNCEPTGVHAYMSKPCHERRSVVELKESLRITQSNCNRSSVMHKVETLHEREVLLFCKLIFPNDERAA